MSANIEKVYVNEYHLLALLKNHTSILDSTVNIMTKNQAAMDQRHNELVKHLDLIINRVNNITDYEYQIKIKQLFSSWAIYTTLLITSIQRTQASILTVLADTQHGRTNYLLISPHQLKEEAIKIKNHLPLGFHLEIELNNILVLYKLMTVEGRITSNHAIFEISLPLQ